MSVRVGHLERHVDVHGVSGTGKVADVFEASNGKCVVVWLSASSSVNVYDSLKALENIHAHGGKTKVVWDWEQAPDPDPMDALREDAEKIQLSDEEMEDIAEETAESIAQVTALKVVEKLAAKVAEKKEEEAKAEPEPEPKPKGQEEAKEPPKKEAPKKRTPAKKGKD